MLYPFGKAFLSHRSQDYSKAKVLRDFLLSSKNCREVVLWDNESLCRNYEQLTVHDYFEALNKLKASMNSCDSFLFIKSPNYLNGYFTSAELTIWRWIKDNPVVYEIDTNNENLPYHEFPLNPMSKADKRQLSYSSFLMKPDPAHDLEYGFSKDNWGKYAKDCFLVGCCSCGEYYLIGYQKMLEYIDSHAPVACPNCQKIHCKFERHPSKQSYFSYRHPIIMKPTIPHITDLKPLSVDDILILLGAKELPSRFKLVSSPKDKFRSDNVKNGIFALKFTASLIAIIGAGVAALNIFGSDENKNK